MKHDLQDGIFVRESTGAGPGAVLCVHGLGESALGFEGLLARPELRDWRLVAPDLPGYGRTAWPKSPLSLSELADVAARFAVDRDLSPSVVVGHSLGGVLALLIAERHPEIVRAVVDVDGNKSLDDCVFSGQAAAQELDEFLDGGFDALRDRIYTAGADEPAQRGYYASLRLAEPRSFWQHSRELVELARGDQLAARLASLSVPRLYVAGSPGGACPRSRELLREAAVPVAEISPSGHWPFLDRPDDFVAVLRDFLDGLPD